jgi:catechol 2,3-dioxygenase-like lactoylglutathione lyase family enzyme
MITGITHTTRYVPNYEQALAFYRDMLDFEVKTDNYMQAPKMRWLGMSLPQQPSVELVLMQPSDWFQGEALEAANSQIGKQAQLILSTDDIEALYAKLKTANVTLKGEINTMPWGRDLTLNDPFGNSIYVVQNPST